MISLLIPRYKVIADYPDSNQPLNSLLIQTRTVPLFQNNTNGCEMRFSSIQKYPHIFREMEWHEEIKETDFPKYLKRVTGEVFKIIEYNFKKTTAKYGKEECEEFFYDIGNYLPATEDEYSEFLNSL